MQCRGYLVLTFALPKETPIKWLRSKGVPVYTLSSLRSGAFRKDHNKGVVAIITGAGFENSKRAGQWISENLNPLFVVNIGTCGLIDRRLKQRSWYLPLKVFNSKGQSIELEPILPLSFKDFQPVDSLISLEKPLESRACYEEFSTVDMEAYPQAEIFSRRGISFHVLKFGTDHLKNSRLDYQKNLGYFSDSTKRVLSFLEDRDYNVSVVIPTYNRRKKLRRAVESVLGQTFPPSEIVVVDDGSTDGTAEVLSKYKHKINVIKIPFNAGVSIARNIGVLFSRFCWIAFLDSDDLWKKNKLESQIEYLRQYPFFRIMQSEELWYRRGLRVNPCRHHTKPLGWAWRRSLQRCLISPSSVLMRRELFEEFGGFREELPVCEDYDLWIRITRHYPVGLDPNPVVIKHGGNDDQLSRAFPAMDRFRLRVLLEQYLKEWYPPYRKILRREMQKKLSVLIKGAEKRNKMEDLKFYYTVRDFLKEEVQYHREI